MPIPSFEAPADLKWPAAQDSIKTVIVHSTRHLHRHRPQGIMDGAGHALS